LDAEMVSTMTSHVRLISGVLVTGALLASASVKPSQAAAKIYGFQCLKSQSSYVIGLGSMPAPGVGGTAMSPAAVAPLQGSGSIPIAVITPAKADFPVDRRCSSIAARLTNLALATNSATPAGIINLTNHLVAGSVEGSPVIAIKSLSKGNVLATLPTGVDPQQALKFFGDRIQRVAARKVISNALNDGDIIKFIIISN
jgi:hypothetical protein